MNHIYRLIWNEVQRAWVVTHKKVRTRSKRSSGVVGGSRAAVAAATAIAAMTAMAEPPPATTLPQGGQLIAGQAAIATSGATMNIQQSSQQAILNWQQFSIGSDATVNFQQTGAEAVALNRVLGSDPSAIYGKLNANGQVFLVNPNGTLFANSAQVNVGGLVASSLNISDQDFQTGNYQFDGNATGSVTNLGELNAKYVALLAPEVINGGVITTRMGTTALAGSDSVRLNITGNSLIDVEVSQASIDTLVENRQMVSARDGQVIMSAQSATGLLGQVINSGTIEAKGLVNDGGVIRFTASDSIDLGGEINADAGTNGDGGTILAIADLDNADSSTDVSASLSARGGSESGDGGFIETSASNLNFADNIDINTHAANGENGEWLLDPVDFTIAAAGGDITGTALSTALGSNNVTIQTTDTSASCTPEPTLNCGAGDNTGNGDIFVNDAIAWSAANTLTLDAWRDININATVGINADSSGAGGGLVLQYGQGNPAVAGVGNNDAQITVTGKVDLGANTSYQTKFGNDGFDEDYTILRTLTDLTDIVATADADFNGIGGSFALGADLVIASGTWTPIGDGSAGGTFLFPQSFDGTFDGLGHTLTGIDIPNTTNAMNVGMFGLIGGSGLVRNLGVLDANVAGLANVGALAGQSLGTFHNVWSSGTITGSDVAGVGPNTLTNDDVVGSIGGLIGLNFGQITRSRSEANVTALSGDQSAGGGVGGGIGGLVGAQAVTAIFDNYATGEVKGLNEVGGLIGNAAGHIISGYASGAVNTGVAGATKVGGLIGENAGINVTGSFWDEDTTGQIASAGGTGLTTAEMQDPDNFTSSTTANGSVNPDWDVSRYWVLESNEYPRFFDSSDFMSIAAVPGSITISLDNTNQIYGSELADSALTGFAVTGLLATDTISAAGWGTGYSDALPVGLYAYNTTDLIDLEGNFNSSAGNMLSEYSINLPTDKGLTVTPAPLTFSLLTGEGNTISRVYDGSTSALVPASSFMVTGFVLSEGGVVNSGGVQGTFDSANVNPNQGVAQAVSVNLNDINLDLNANVLPSNYYLSGGPSISADIGFIEPKALTISGTTAADREYDGTTDAAITAGTLVGLVGVEDLSVSAIGLFDTKDAGKRTVTVTYMLADGDAGIATNYTLADTVDLIANITKRELRITGGLSLSNPSRVYDGSIEAGGLTGAGEFSGLVAGEEFFAQLPGTSSFADKNAGLGKQVVVSPDDIVLLASEGTSLDNYNFTSVAILTGDITRANLTLTGSRIYDGTTQVAGSDLTANGVNGESFGVIGNGAANNLASKNVMDSPQALASLEGLRLGNGNSEAALPDNYSALTVTGSEVTITPREVTVVSRTPLPSVIPGTVLPSGEELVVKYYDGTTAVANPHLEFADGAILGDDAVSLSGYTAEYIRPDVGTSTAKFTGIAITNDGDEARNYEVPGQYVAPGQIVAKPVAAGDVVGWLTRDTGQPPALGPAIAADTHPIITQLTPTLRESIEQISARPGNLPTSEGMLSMLTRQIALKSTARGHAVGGGDEGPIDLGQAIQVPSGGEITLRSSGGGAADENFGGYDPAPTVEIWLSPLTED